MRYIAAYDIADDGRRADVALYLSALGPRVQLSVFEIDLPDQAAYTETRAALRALIDGVEDQIRIYPVAIDWNQADVLGARTCEERREYWIV